MKDEFAGIEPRVYESSINVPYSWWAGDTASRFFTAIRDDKKILGSKCGKCGTVYLPPRKSCISCFVDTDEWVELSSEGEVIAVTVARRQLAALKSKVPVVFALIKLGGADTAILHIIKTDNPDSVEIGMKVRARFAEERTGGIMDIECFEPV